MSDDPRRENRWLARHLAAEWPTFSGGAVVMAARAGVLLLLPWPLKFIIDDVIFQHPLPGWLRGILPDPAGQRLDLLAALGLAIVVLGATDALLAYGGNRLFLDAAQRVAFAIRRDLFAHLQRLSLEFHRRHLTGELMSRLSGDVKDLQESLASAGIDLLPHALTILGMATMMVVLDWRFALLTLAFAPVLGFIARFYTDRIRGAQRSVRRHDGQLWGMTQQILGSVHVVQAFAREDHEDRRFLGQAGKGLAAALSANRIQSQFAPAMNLTIAVATGLIVWYGATQAVLGRLTAGDLLVFLAYLRGITTPARQLAKTGRVVGRALVALERIDETRAERPGIADPAGAAEPAGCAGRVEFNAVSFGFRAEEPVLHDVSFVLEPGRTVALVGPTGSGKSTIASLVSRFHDPQSGQVLLDGRDLRTLPLRFLRRQVAWVPQEPMLLQGTIWENIAYGREGAGREDAVRAARAAGIDDVIERIPGGFDADVAERGASLSGGERQCVAIARAMLCDAPVVIFDEPTSSLDGATEQRLIRTLGPLTERRSALVIAHRLSTVAHADLILVLDRGRIVQRGSHDELMQQTGPYSSLWSAAREDGAHRRPARLVKS